MLTSSNTSDNDSNSDSESENLLEESRLLVNDSRTYLDPEDFANFEARLFIASNGNDLVANGDTPKENEINNGMDDNNVHVSNGTSQKNSDNNPHHESANDFHPDM